MDPSSKAQFAPCGTARTRYPGGPTKLDRLGRLTRQGRSSRALREELPWLRFRSPSSSTKSYFAATVGRCRQRSSNAMSNITRSSESCWPVHVFGSSGGTMDERKPR